MYPNNVAVIGGGRWARVLTEVLCGIVPPAVRISVHSPHNAGAMSSWTSERGWGQHIVVTSKLPQFPDSESNAVIVVNAARDHEKAIEWALSAGVPVLVEKPVTLTAAASRRLADMAISRNTRFAAAHIFLFTRYLENFLRITAGAGKIKFLRVQWTDPRSENRYGEQKQYDPGLPIFSDWLPHVLSMVGTLTSGLPQRCEKLKFLRGGAHLELELMLGDIPCIVQLVRNGDARQRIIEVNAEKKNLRLDFSKEPGTISSGSERISGDPDWEAKERPSARMLRAFLRWAAGGEFDGRLDIEVGLRANRVIDQALNLYRSQQIPWLAAKLASPGEVDDDLRYALCEILQYEASLPSDILAQKIDVVRKHFSDPAELHRLRELDGFRDPASFLTALTG